jgi:hypothetical protein
MNMMTSKVVRTSVISVGVWALTPLVLIQCSVCAWIRNGHQTMRCCAAYERGLRLGADQQPEHMLDI